MKYGLRKLFYIKRFHIELFTGNDFGTHPAAIGTNRGHPMYDGQQLAMPRGLSERGRNPAERQRRYAFGECGKSCDLRLHPRQNDAIRD